MLPWVSFEIAIEVSLTNCWSPIVNFNSECDFVYFVFSIGFNLFVHNQRRVVTSNVIAFSTLVIFTLKVGPLHLQRHDKVSVRIFIQLLWNDLMKLVRVKGLLLCLRWVVVSLLKRSYVLSFVIRRYVPGAARFSNLFGLFYAYMWLFLIHRLVYVLATSSWHERLSTWCTLPASVAWQDSWQCALIRRNTSGVSPRAIRRDVPACASNILISLLPGL